MQTGDRVWVTAEPNGYLTSRRPRTDRICGCWPRHAIGPFLSILKTEAPWQRYERIVLVHAVRRVADLGYRRLVDELLERRPGQLQFVPFVSRESTGFALTGRIPEAIADGRLEAHAGLRLSPDDSTVMICGNSGMIATRSRCWSSAGSGATGAASRVT